jgi:hypothetical protein
MKRIILLCLSHAVAIAIGFALGIYALPILTAPAGPTGADVTSLQKEARFKGEFRRDLKGSDLFHWGEGTVSLDAKGIALMGKLAPGPDYKLYLVPEFVDTRDKFLAVKTSALRVGDVKTFENFLVPLPAGIDLEKYNTVLVWCETFSMFITAARYR